jgi:uncharacterized protein
VQHHLVIMAKAPRMGRVKTRLARDIGTVAAWSFYRHTLAAVARPLIADRRWQTWLCVSPDSSVGAVHQWPRRARRIAQGPGDLGTRMARVMGALPPGPVVLIGADIPDIRSADIASAFRLLGSHQAVFGPADDGGYWLVGQRRRPRRLTLFSDVRWSSSHALADTLKNIPAAVRIGYLRELSDVDDGTDYQALTATNGSRFRPPT